MRQKKLKSFARVERTSFLHQMFDPPTSPTLDILVAERAAVGLSWSLGSYALLHFGVSIEFAGRNCFLAFGTSFVVFVVCAFCKKVVVECAYFDCLAALRTKGDHPTA